MLRPYTSMTEDGGRTPQSLSKSNQCAAECPCGEEPQILNANQDLLDGGLLQAMAQVAEFLEKRGDHNNRPVLKMRRKQR